MRKLNRNGYSLVELMVSLVILVGLLGVILMALFTGQNSWHTTRGNIELRENMRMVLLRVAKELRETGSNGPEDADNDAVLDANEDTNRNGTLNQVTLTEYAINNNGGVGGSDILTFAIPVSCQAAGNFIQINGNAYWGAPLTWGCTTSVCMDADNSCATVDYRRIQYALNANNAFERRVLDNANNVVRTDVFAGDIINFQAAFGGEDADMDCVIDAGEDTNGNGRLDGGSSITLSITGRVVTSTNRILTETASRKIFLRNRGCSI